VTGEADCISTIATLKGYLTDMIEACANANV